MPYALQGFVGPDDRVVAAGELVAADDPVIVGREHLFSELPAAGAAVVSSVEVATAEPGEVRQFRRPTVGDDEVVQHPSAGRGRTRKG